MDDSDRSRDRTPDWRGRPGSGPPGASRQLPPARYDEPSKPTNWLVTVGIVLVLGVAAMAILTTILREWRPDPATSANAALVPQNVQRASAQQEFAAADELERQQRLKAQQETDQKRALAVKQRESQEAAAQRAAALQARRERDWQAYYKKPAWCDEALATVDSVGCANDYIRARRAFEAQFSSTKAAR